MLDQEGLVDLWPLFPGCFFATRGHITWFIDGHDSLTHDGKMWQQQHDRPINNRMFVIGDVVPTSNHDE